MKLKLSLTTFLVPILLTAQFNLQQHYDLGREIQTTTAEFFKECNNSVTFAFIDINYDQHHFEKKGATDIWYELAWYHKLPLSSGQLNGTIQYNDGLYFFPGDSISLRTAIQPAWLVGISYPFQIGEYVIPIDLLLRRQEGDNNLTFQITVIWFIPLSQRFTILGNLDFWTNSTGPIWSIQAEPQLLVNFGQASIGLEMEISRAFPGAWTTTKEYFDAFGNPREKDWWFIPTLFIKYTF
ncbi:MAG: DUF5020 family protein [Candidatus Marinimicrobia bacterium]|nr:DUF5020 family protein [Candidatus Neomarinimicrobiota bacterium]